VLAERARIARDLHDGVSQTLYAITLGVARARGLLQRNQADEAQQLIDDVLRLATDGQSELRAFLTDIRSDTVDCLGLMAALDKLVAEIRTRHQLDIRLSAADEPDLPPATREALVMIASEALHNIVRHAAASRVDLALVRTGGQLHLVIADDGHGFDTTLPRPGHFGLQGMRERASAIGATFAVWSSVGRGTVVRISVAYAAARSLEVAGDRRR
jgi:signal transduction histidine kinase